MRIVAHFYTTEAVNDAQSRLEKAGIPVIVEFHHGMQSKRLGRPYTLLVAFDEQFQDARNLLENPQHAVKNPIDIQAFKRHMNQHLREGGDLTVILNAVVGSLLGLFALVILFILFSR